jgi:pyridoxal phosphate enzyme (YggS family)
MSDAVDTAALAERYAAVRAATPAHVTLVAVSKTRTVAEIQALYDLGHRDFGENYPQELRDKQPLLPDDIRWHFIGHLQRNKVKYIAPFVDLVHAADSEALLDELDKRAAAATRRIDVLLQLHIAQEESKHGLDEPALLRLLESRPAERWPHLRLRGLMGMATFTDDKAMVRGEFERLGRLYTALRNEQRVPPDVFSVLSMGMCGDLPEAIAAGSTMVRVGTAIFGERGA